MTDAQRMLVLLRKAGALGVHTHDLRREGISGNPSQRAADLEAKGHHIRRVRENRGKRPGSRFFLEPAGSSGEPCGGPPATSAAARSNGNRVRFERAEKSKGRREFIHSTIPGEPRRWTRTNCPPLGDLESLQTVDEALGMLSAA